MGGTGFDLIIYLYPSFNSNNEDAENDNAINTMYSDGLHEPGQLLPTNQTTTHGTFIT